MLNVLLECLLFFASVSGLFLYAYVRIALQEHNTEKQNNFEQWQQDRIINRILHADF